MRSAFVALCTGFFLAVAGCAAEDEDADESAAALQEREYAFRYSNPDIPFSPTQLKTLQAALHRLATIAHQGRSPLRRKLAAHTLARIEAGDVLIGAVGSARGIDRFHMCKDFKLPACQGAAPADDDKVWMGDEALSRKLETSLDGYQWGNRLYFTIKRTTDIDELASTFVHEVNHVLNRSECSYYSNVSNHVMDGNKAFVEEYRAYLAECYYVKDQAANEDVCTEYAAKMLELYGFEHDLSKIVPRGQPAELRTVTKLLVDSERAFAPLGRLVAEASMWPRAFGACGR